MMLLKNSAGNPSASFTFAVVTFTITMLWYLLAMFQDLGPIKIRPFDATSAMAVLLPIMGLYFGRRYTEDVVQNASGQGNRINANMNGDNTTGNAGGSSNPVGS